MLPMTLFKLQTSGIRSDRSANCATTNSQTETKFQLPTFPYILSKQKWTWL